MGHNLHVIFDRFRAKSATRRDQAKATESLEAALCDFSAARLGVQAWVEEPTGFNKASLLLVAADGEWMRRAVPSTEWGRDFASREHLVCYTAGIDPYPQRMRDWDAAHRKPKETAGD